MFVKVSNDLSPFKREPTEDNGMVREGFKSSPTKSPVIFSFLHDRL